MAKELVNILRPLVGMFPYVIKNKETFTEQVKSNGPEEGEYITSYDVKALFSSVFVESVISIIKNMLEKETEIQNRTSLSMHHITTLL